MFVVDCFSKICCSCCANKKRYRAKAKKRPPGFWEEENMTTEALEKYNQKKARTKQIRDFFIHIGLVSLLVIYSFVGAVIFKELENSGEERNDVQIDITSAKETLIENLRIHSALDVDSENWTLAVMDMLVNYDAEIAAASKYVDVLDETNHQKNVSLKWDIWKALFYASTIYTSIGYGHLYPLTVGGRIATMLYATFGIPLCLIVLADIGGLLSDAIKFLLKSIKRCVFRCKSNQDTSLLKEEDINNLSGISVFICLLAILTLFMFIGAAFYTLWEDQWTYFDAFYFIFISISTIGLGDVLPNHPKYFLLSFLYIFLGLSLISTGFTVLQQIMQTTVTKVTDEIDAKLGIEKEEEEEPTGDQPTAEVPLQSLEK